MIGRKILPAKTKKPTGFRKRYWTSDLFYSINEWFDCDVNARLQEFNIFTSRFRVINSYSMKRSGTFSIKKIISGLSWPALITDFFSVLLAVFLAFVLNEWRTERADAYKAEIAVEGIQGELNRNLAFLEANSPYHDTLQMAMVGQISLLQKGAITAKEITYLKENVPLNLIRLNDNAWIAARETQAIEFISFELVSMLSETYHDQEAYNILVQSFYDNLFKNLDFYEGHETSALYLLETLFGSLVQVEHQLMESYRKSLEEISSQDHN